MIVFIVYKSPEKKIKELHSQLSIAYSQWSTLVLEDAL